MNMLFNLLKPQLLQPSNRVGHKSISLTGLLRELKESM